MATPSSSSISFSSSSSHLVTIKLTSENYMLWKVQLTAYLRGQDLFSFVDGTQIPPPKMFPAESNSNPKTNPAFLSWQRTDQFILSILLSSITKLIVAHVISAGTSRELWTSLESMYSSRSQAKEFQIRFQLTNLSCGDQSIVDYFSKVKMLADTLAATGTPLSDKEYVTYFLNGLGPNYEPFITSITTRIEPIHSQELYHLLLIHENRLTHNSRNTTPSPFEPSANLTTNSRDNRGRGFYRGRSNRSHGRFTSNRGRTLANYSPSYPNNSQRPTCQVCNKSGHIALQCHFRFDHAYQYDPPKSFSANYTSPSAIIDPSWYPNSVATHHITHDLSHLNLSPEPYNGHEQICVGNGTGLQIHNIGDSSFPINFSSFKLHNLLHVPSITKNLVCLTILH